MELKDNDDFWGTSIVWDYDTEMTEMQMTVNPGRLVEVVTYLCNRMYLVSQYLDLEELYVDGVCECGCPTPEPTTDKPSRTPSDGPSQTPSVRPSKTPSSGPSKTPFTGPSKAPSTGPS